MLHHSTIVAGFVPVQDAAVDSVISRVLDEIASEIGEGVSGEDVRKLGYVEQNAALLCSRLRAAGYPVARRLVGELKGVGYVVNLDSRGVQHHKLRVMLDERLLSLDLSSEYAQRLAVKLEGVLANRVAGPISISSFVEVIPRSGRSYVNHLASLKDRCSLEVKAVKDHFRIAQDQVAEAISKVRSSSAKAEERKAVKTEYFAALVQKLALCRPMPSP